MREAAPSMHFVCNLLFLTSSSVLHLPSLVNGEGPQGARRIEPAERESRRAPRGKPARPCFWTHGKTTPRCSILGGPIGIQICIQILLVFLILVTLVGCRFASFLVQFLIHFGGLWAPFCIILEPFGVHWASLEGSLEEGCFFIDFWRPKWLQSGTNEAPQIHSKWVQNSIVFVDPFLDAFWVPKLRPNRRLKR